MAGIYLHIPFCKQACHYCDFHFSTSMKMKDDFILSLKKEIILQKNYLIGEKINTIYFGGGTPSLLSREELSELISDLHIHYDIDEHAEITLEANPDDLSIYKLKELKAASVNRLSIGIQSFFEEDLRFMNRAHHAKEAIQCITNAQEVGFDNITIDLIYGTPTLSDNHWINNLETAYSLGIPHLSCYCLTVEPKTALANFILQKKVPDVDEQKSSHQFEIMLEAMNKNGFEQYEISNFCKGENYSKHNTAYWQGEKYLGLGPSAHSFNGSTRQWNVSNNAEYIKSITENTIPFELETLTMEQKFNEYLLTSLRTKWGTDINKIEQEFGKEVFELLMKQASVFVERELIILDKNHLYLSTKGKLVADAITSDLFKI